MPRSLLPRYCLLGSWMLLATSLWCLAGSAIAADAPKASLHERIDRLLEQGSVGPSAVLQRCRFCPSRLARCRWHDSASRRSSDISGRCGNGQA